MDGDAIGYWSLLAVAGLACGLLNTLASSGSAVTLPLMVILGIPESAANATNRLPVFIGSVIATISLARSGKMDWKAALPLSLPVLSGAILGALLAEYIPSRQMGLLITFAILIALLLLFTKIKQALSQVSDSKPRVTPKAFALMFIVGFWLGLIVLDGATYLLLVLMLVCAYPLAEANAIKVFLIAVSTFAAIMLFWNQGDIRWTEGIVLSAGSVIGGIWGARLTCSDKARFWAFRLLFLVISLELVHLVWHYSSPYLTRI